MKISVKSESTMHIFIRILYRKLYDYKIIVMQARKNKIKQKTSRLGLHR